MANMRSIDIDFDVNKVIEVARESFSESPNDVLRRLLKIGEKSGNTKDRAPAPDDGASMPVGRPWSGKGVTLPHGTAIRMEYNGTMHTGSIEDGEWVVGGVRYRSPSAAAGGVARTRSGSSPSLDGWIYWRAKRPGDARWVAIQKLREAASG
jgi:hypothetical protein